MLLHLQPGLLSQLQELIYGQCSLRFSPSRMINLETQIRERIEARGLSSLEDYFSLLQKDLHEFDTLIEGITTKETHFFRLPGQFEALRKEVLPWIEDRLSQEAQRRVAEGIRERTRNIPLRIWSAGCATGEEPYSIAMAVMEGLRYSRAWKVEILASDISQEAVKTASLGSYEAGDLAQIPAGYQEKYMRTVNDRLVMADGIKDKVSFRVFNLRKLNGEREKLYDFVKIDGNREYINLYGRFDAIFCRNVMIYFDIPAQQRLVDGLYACLRPGGYLFTGDAELLYIYEHNFKSIDYERTIFYRKPE
ncbi:MAG: protein-glutamate O-methyltransferase CheR [Deltaproteobacteria bacterium]|nr:MAG: protein-glutamate O-methyltransferase CheR [Deltaproteobacteria bacterium]